MQTDDTELSDTLLSKADALIRRNRPDGVGSEAEELPLLTDIVTDTIDFDLGEPSGPEDWPPLTASEIARRVAPTEPSRLAAEELSSLKVAERLIDLDAYMQQALQSWIAQELPHLLETELDGMVERLKMKTLAHMRATLLPELSAKLSEVLDATLDDGPVR